MSFTLDLNDLFGKRATFINGSSKSETNNSDFKYF